MLQKPDEECDKKTMPSEAIKLELTWWIDNMVELSAPYHILYRCIPVWMGAVCVNLSTLGKFLLEELQKFEGNINVLELLAV